jgi:hypothetical protein
MKETLTCSSCRKSWKREKARGRKPLVCPKCARSNALVSQPIQNQKPIKTEPKKAIKTQPKIVPKTQETQTTKSSRFDISVVYKTLYPKVEDKQLENQKSGSSWKCSSCGYVLKVFIPICDIPVHKCSPHMISEKQLKRIL